MSALPKKVVLATDGSEDAALAARAAADLAREGGAELHVVHVWRMVPSARFEDYIYGSLKEQAQRLLDAEVRRVEEAGGTVAKAHLREGSPVDEILNLAEEVGADLVIIGTRGRGPIERLLLGSVAEGVAHHAACPVLVVRGGPGAWPPRRVVIGDDSSGDSRLAAELASSIGALYGAKGLLVRAYPKQPETDEEGRRFDARAVDDELHREEGIMEERAGELEEATRLRPRVRISVGNPAEAILEAAVDGDLIAVGSRGLGAGGRMRLGSVSTKVLKAAKGPVLVCPSPRR